MTVEIYEPLFDRKKRVWRPDSAGNENIEYAVIGKNDKFSDSILYKVRRYIHKKQANPLMVPETQVKESESPEVIEESGGEVDKPVESEPGEVKQSLSKSKHKKRKTEKPPPKVSASIQTDPPANRDIPLSWAKSEYQRQFRPWTAPPPVPKPSREPKSWSHPSKFNSRKVDKATEGRATVGKVSEYRSNFRSPCNGAHNSVDSRDWYAQILELRSMANDYEERGRGMHFSRNHFMQLISSNAQMWDLPSPTAKSSVAIDPPRCQLESASPQVVTKTVNVGTTEFAPPSKTVNVGTTEFAPPPKTVNVGTTEFAPPPKTVNVGKTEFIPISRFSVAVQTTNEAPIEPRKVEPRKVEPRKAEPRKAEPKRPIRPKVKFKDTTGIFKRTAKKPSKKFQKTYAVEKIPAEEIPEEPTPADDPLAFTGNLRPKMCQKGKSSFDSILERARKRNNFWTEF